MTVKSSTWAKTLFRFTYATAVAPISAAIAHQTLYELSKSALEPLYGNALTSQPLIGTTQAVIFFAPFLLRKENSNSGEPCTVSLEKAKSNALILALFLLFTTAIVDFFSRCFLLSAYMMDHPVAQVYILFSSTGMAWNFYASLLFRSTWPLKILSLLYIFGISRSPIKSNAATATRFLFQKVKPEILMAPLLALLLAAGVLVLDFVSSNVDHNPVTKKKTTKNVKKRKIKTGKGFKLKALLVIAAAIIACATSGHFQYHQNGRFGQIESFSILERRGSVSAILDTEMNVLYMRAGHSTIGAVFRATLDSAYAVFYYHDMHMLRLVDNKASPPKKALLMGVGVGSAANLMLASNVSVVAYELDENVVYMRASHFLKKSEKMQNLAITVGDALQAMPSKLAEMKEREKLQYDVIVHDLFSGGSVPEELYTFESLVRVRAALKPGGGTLSLNAVGSVLDPSIVVIVRTVAAVFPHVRVYAEKPDEDVTNIVVFASDVKIAFRKFRTSDAFDSTPRANVLSQFEQNEITSRFANILGMTDDNDHDDDDGVDFGSSLAKSVLKFDWNSANGGELPEPPQVNNTKLEFLHRITGDLSNCREVTILTRSNSNCLNILSFEAAKTHWKVMREIIPFGVWAEY